MHEDSTVDTQGGAAGISRRDMLRKSAIVGGAGALMWAAPSVTTFGARAFGAEGTPIGGYSNFGAVATGPDGDVRVKGDFDEDIDDFEWGDAGGMGGCEGAFGEEFRKDWCDADKADGGALGFTFTSTQSGALVYYTLRAPAGYSFKEGAAASLKEGECCYEGEVIDNDSAVRWYGPFSNGSPCEDGRGVAGSEPAHGKPCP